MFIADNTCTSKKSLINTFCENQSKGLFGSMKGLIALLTETQFWSPLRITEEARHSFSRILHCSMGAEVAMTTVTQAKLYISS